MSNHNSDKSQKKYTCGPVQKESNGVLHDKIAELERCLSQAKQYLRNKEALVKIQTDQIKKLEAMYKTSLDERENLNYTNKKTCNDLENLKILLNGHEQPKETRSVDNQTDNDSNYAMKSMLESQQAVIGAIFTLCFFNCYKTWSNATHKILNEEINTLKNISLKLKCIEGSKDETAGGTCSDCVAPPQCRECKRKTETIELLEYEIGDLRQQLEKYKNFPKAFIESICRQSETFVRLVIDKNRKFAVITKKSAPKNSTMGYTISIPPVETDERGLSEELQQLKYRTSVHISVIGNISEKLTNPNKTLNDTQGSGHTKPNNLLVFREEELNNSMAPSIDQTSAMESVKDSAMTRDATSMEATPISEPQKKFRDFGTNPWTATETTVKDDVSDSPTSEPEQQIDLINYAEHIKLLEEENSLLESSVEKLKSVCNNVSTDRLSPARNLDGPEIQKLKKQVEQLKKEFSTLKVAFEEHLNKVVDLSDCCSAVVQTDEDSSENKRLACLTGVQKDLQLLYVEFDTFRQFAAENTRRLLVENETIKIERNDLNNNLMDVQKALVESKNRAASEIEENGKLKECLKHYTELGDTTNNKLLKEFLDFKNDFNSRIEEIRFMVDNRKKPEDVEGLVSQLIGVTNDLKVQLQTSVQENDDTVCLLQKENNYLQEQLDMMNDECNKLIVLRQCVISHVEEVRGFLPKVATSDNLIETLNSVTNAVKENLQELANKAAHFDEKIQLTKDAFIRNRADYDKLTQICNDHINELIEIKVAYGGTNDNNDDTEDMQQKLLKNASDVKNILASYKKQHDVINCTLNKDIRELNKHVELLTADLCVCKENLKSSEIVKESKELQTSDHDMERRAVLENELRLLKVERKEQINQLVEDCERYKEELENYQGVIAIATSLKDKNDKLMTTYNELLNKYNVQKDNCRVLEQYKKQLDEREEENKELNCRLISTNLDVIRYRKKLLCYENECPRSLGSELYKDLQSYEVYKNKLEEISRTIDNYLEVQKVCKLNQNTSKVLTAEEYFGPQIDLICGIRDREKRKTALDELLQTHEKQLRSLFAKKSKTADHSVCSCLEMSTESSCNVSTCSEDWAPAIICMQGQIQTLLDGLNKYDKEFQVTNLKMCMSQQLIERKLCDIKAKNDTVIAGFQADEKDPGQNDPEVVANDKDEIEAGCSIV